MKLNSINRLDEALALHRAYLITEGLVSDLIGSKISQFQSWVQGHSKIVKTLGFEDLVAAAKKLDCSLLDSEANEWWIKLFVKFAERRDGEIPEKVRNELIANIKKKIEPQINREMEDVQKRLEDMAAKRAAAGKSKEELAKWLQSAMFDGWETTHERGRNKKNKRNRRDYQNENDAYDTRDESKINYGNLYAESLGSTIAGALDMMNPNQRVNKGASIVRASNNAKIATLAITMIAKEIRNIKPVRKKEKPVDAEVVDPDDKTKGKYELAKFTNAIIQKNSGPHYKGKPSEEECVAAIQKKSKELTGDELPKLKRLPKDQFDVSDFEGFKKKYGKKDGKKAEEPIKAEAVPEKRRKPSEEREDDTYKHLDSMKTQKESKRK